MIEIPVMIILIKVIQLVLKQLKILYVMFIINIMLKRYVKFFLLNLFNVLLKEEPQPRASKSKKKDKNGFQLKFDDDSYAECYPGYVQKKKSFIY